MKDWLIVVTVVYSLVLVTSYVILRLLVHRERNKMEQLIKELDKLSKKGEKIENPYSVMDTDGQQFSGASVGDVAEKVNEIIEALSSVQGQVNKLRKDVDKLK